MTSDIPSKVEEPTEQELSESIISVSHVDKVYGQESRDPIRALEDINLNIRKNEFVSLIGPSGCGKTTLLKCVGDIIEPTTGKISIDGQPATTARHQNLIAFFFQEDVLLPWRSVMGNVQLPLEIQGKNTDDPAMREQTQEVIETVGLQGFENSRPQELSGGMRQRVALARGFVYNPTIFLMDEPFAALDELTRRKMNQELLRIHEEIRKTTLFVTHHIPEAVWLSDRVVILSPRPGKVSEIVDIELERPRNEETRHQEAFTEYEEYLTKTVMEFEE